MSRKGIFPLHTRREKIVIDVWIFGSILVVGIGAAVIAGAEDDRIIVVVLAIALISTVVLHFVFENRARRTHTPEERAALAAQLKAKSQLERDRIKFVNSATTYKRDVLRTGVRGRAVITDVAELRDGADNLLIYLELSVTVGADPPYAVRTGEHPSVWARFDNPVAVGRELAVRVDLTDRQRVAVEWTPIVEDWTKNHSWKKDVKNLVEDRKKQE
jgi:hypothetical protein